MQETETYNIHYCFGAFSKEYIARHVNGFLPEWLISVEAPEWYFDVAKIDPKWCTFYDSSTDKVICTWLLHDTIEKSTGKRVRNWLDNLLIYYTVLVKYWQKTKDPIAKRKLDRDLIKYE